MKLMLLLTVLNVIFVAKIYGNINDGLLHSFLYSKWIYCEHSKSLNINVSETKIYFYDFQNDLETSHLVDHAVDGITSALNLDVNRKLIFFVPGFKSNITKNSSELLRQTFQDVPNIYLIIVDHSPYTAVTDKIVEIVDSYERAVKNVYYLGEALGTFLAGLHKKGFPSSNIHCIGHSLGSQMLGYAGTAYTSQTNEKIWRITGLDPAGPCFANSLIDDQIRSGVAEYVEVYHCNIDVLGTTSVLADTDFFFNKEGVKQLDCHAGKIPTMVGDYEASKCSHKACLTYYAQTVHHSRWFEARRCDTYKSFTDGRCAANQVTIAGYSNPGNATGVFYVSTDGYQ